MAVDERVKSALRRTAKNDAESWSQKTVVKTKDKLISYIRRSEDDGGKNEKDDEGREERVINFNFWFLRRSLSTTRRPD